MNFRIGETAKVKLDAQAVKPELRGRRCEVIAITGSIEPFHFVVKINQKEYVLRGDELQTVYAYDMELLKLWEKIK